MLYLFYSQIYIYKFKTHDFHMLHKFYEQIQWKTKNTTMSEQFQNLIEISKKLKRYP
jgi:hypothetical protein